MVYQYNCNKRCNYFGESQKKMLLEDPMDTTALAKVA